jgi:hypothetical protein
MEELGGLDDEDTEAAKIYIEQLKSMIEESKKKALEEKRKENIAAAKKHLE